MGVAPGAATTFWSIFANSSLEIDDILKWALQMSETENRTTLPRAPHPLDFAQVLNACVVLCVCRVCGGARVK